MDTGTEVGIRIDEDGDVSTYAPAFDHLRNQNLFTRTLEEELLPWFSTDLTARCRSPQLDVAATDEMFVDDDIAVCRIMRYLAHLDKVVHELVEVYERVRFNPFYWSVWPWFRGQDDLEGRRNGGRDGSTNEVLEKPEDLSGPSAGQCVDNALDMILRPDDDRVHTLTFMSTLVHSMLGCFSAVCKCTYWAPPHLRHISANPRPVHQLVEGKGHPELVNAHNSAVGAVKPFRDLHIRIMVIRPASRERYGVQENSVGHGADASRDAGG